MGLFNRGTTTTSTHTHGGVHTAHLWSVLLLAFASWIVLLGGLSAVQDECRSNQSSNLTFLQANRICSSAYRYPWWVLWLAFFVFLGVLGTAIFGTLDRGRVALSSFLAFTAALLVIQTDAFLTAHDGNTDNARFTTTFVGFLLTTIFTLALIIVVGTTHAHVVDGGAPVRSTTTTSKV